MNPLIVNFQKMHKYFNFFYIQSNYKENNVGDESSENEDEDTWSDWKDEDIGISCLFCNHSDKHFHLILGHMKTEHDFDFEIASKDLTFYQKV